MAWTSTASTELDLPNGAKVYEGTFDAICGNFGHIGGTTGLAWIDWTPTVYQGGAVAATVVTAKYLKIRNMAVAKAYLAITAAGTSGNNIKVQGIPAAITPVVATSDVVAGAGSAAIQDAGTGLYICAGYPASSTNIQFLSENSAAGPVGYGAFSLANGDSIGFTLVWETS